MRKKSVLRADTTLAPTEEPQKEIYIRELPVCCLRSFRAGILAAPDEPRRNLTLECDCGRRWIVTSSLDELVLDRFVTHAGPRAGTGNRPPAA